MVNKHDHQIYIHINNLVIEVIAKNSFVQTRYYKELLEILQPHYKLEGKDNG